MTQRDGHVSTLGELLARAVCLVAVGVGALPLACGSSAADPASRADESSIREQEQNRVSSPDATMASPADPQDGGPPDRIDPNTLIPPRDEEGCHAIYAQDVLPEFELVLAPEVWEQLKWEWDHGEETKDSGVDHNPYHPVEEFRYGDVVIHGAEIRLRGNPDFWDPLPGDKMQFQIGFHRGPPGHFLGLKRLALDAATFNRHLLRDRLSLAFMRGVGVLAPCANNAKLFVNGEYYGIFTNLEKIDEVFVKRAFEDPTGDLWKRQGWELKTNEDTSTDAHLEELVDATTLDLIDRHLDLEVAMRVFAAEAIIPNSDGPWAGALNFYLYDNPQSGKFDLLPWDLDGTFERFSDHTSDANPDGEPLYPVDADPVTWQKPERFHGRPWFDIPLQSDPEWLSHYIQLVGEYVEAGYTPEEMHRRIDEYSAQIRQAVLDDTNKPYSNDLYELRLRVLRDFVDERYAFLSSWIECSRDGGGASCLAAP